MRADTILIHLNEIFCPNDNGRALCGKEMADATILKNGYIAIKDGLIYAVGEGDVPPDLIGEDTAITDLKNCIATPGLIDSHTHLVHGGSRENEFSMKLNGVSYLDILKAGGGILSTVTATRNASFEQLVEKTQKTLDNMLIHGVTTTEGKSGYGLEWATEKKQMEVVRTLNESHPMDIISTFMGAHAIPSEYKDCPEKFIDLLINEMIPNVAKENLAEFCDIFCEEGVFSIEQSRRILTAARQNGLKLKIHADEIESIGGAELAGELCTHSAEHLMAASDEGISSMAKSGVIANLLPATTFSLMKTTYANARKMLEHNLAIALSSDFNPGSCPTENLQLVMQLSCLAMKLTPIEVYNAVTINAAHCLALGDKIGSFKIGKQADITIFDAPNLEFTLYHFGTNHVKQVYKKGILVAEDRRVLYR